MRHTSDATKNPSGVPPNDTSSQIRRRSDSAHPSCRAGVTKGILRQIALPSRKSRITNGSHLFGNLQPSRHRRNRLARHRNRLASNQASKPRHRRSDRTPLLRRRIGKDPCIHNILHHIGRERHRLQTQDLGRSRHRRPNPVGKIVIRLRARRLNNRRPDIGHLRRRAPKQPAPLPDQIHIVIVDIIQSLLQILTPHHLRLSAANIPVRIRIVARWPFIRYPIAILIKDEPRVTGIIRNSVSIRIINRWIAREQDPTLIHPESEI